MTKTVIAKSSGFISALHPYDQDAFVRSEYVEIDDTEGHTGKYLKFVKGTSALPFLVERTAKANGADVPLTIIDCGVFMGTFSVAAGLAANENAIAKDQHAYEANKALIDSIRFNFETYGLDVAVHNNAISGEAGTLEFAHSDTGIIGGSLIGATGRAEGFTKQVCDVLPLYDILPDDDALAIVKLDIEGSETSAFNSINGHANKMNNVFIVEYGPWQGATKLDDGATYNDFLINNFDIIDLKNWMFCKLKPLTDASALERVLEENKNPFNTDIALIPKSHRSLYEDLISRFID